MFDRIVRMSALRTQLSELRAEIRDARPEDRDVLLDEAVATVNRIRELETERA